MKHFIQLLILIVFSSCISKSQPIEKIVFDPQDNTSGYLFGGPSHGQLSIFVNTAELITVYPWN
jgi:hypothetical protein